MDKKQALKILTDAPARLKKTQYNGRTKDEVQEAIDVAIEALKQSYRRHADDELVAIIRGFGLREIQPHPDDKKSGAIKGIYWEH